MDIKEINEIIAIFEKSKLQKLCFKKDGFEIILEKGEKTAVSPVVVEKIAKKEVAEKEDCLFIESPMVGTFYSAPSPDKKDFVKVGDKISKDSVVCIIEAMKVMNEVKAGEDGVITEILSKNAQPVEFGTKLFKIEKS